MAEVTSYSTTILATFGSMVFIYRPVGLVLSFLPSSSKIEISIHETVAMQTAILKKNEIAGRVRVKTVTGRVI